MTLCSFTPSCFNAAQYILSGTGHVCAFHYFSNPHFKSKGDPYV